MERKNRLVEFLSSQIKILENRKDGYIDEVIWNLQAGLPANTHRAFTKVFEMECLIDSLQFGLDSFK